MVVNGMSGIFANQSFPADRGTLVFGRSTSSCNIVFPDNVRGISRTHCKIEQSGAGCTITDLGSSYGTFVNGMKIQQYVPTTLKNGDTFYLGDKANMFSFQCAQNMAPAAGMPVTYLNQGNASADSSKSSKDSNGSKNIIIGIAVAAVVVIGVIFVVANNMISEREREMQMLQQENQAIQQELEAEQNKGFFGNLVDTIEDGVELFN